MSWWCIPDGERHLTCAARPSRPGACTRPEPLSRNGPATLRTGPDPAAAQAAARGSGYPRSHDGVKAIHALTDNLRRFCQDRIPIALGALMC